MQVSLPVSNIPQQLNSGQDNAEEKITGTGFREFFANALQEVNQLQLAKDAEVQKLVAGQTDNLHQVIIAAEKANVALQLTTEIRNKILDAYFEIMRMQV